MNTYHDGGFAGGMDVQRGWQLATFNVSNSVIAALIIVVASFIGGLGLACCIGFIFTVPYANTINAGAAGGSRRFRVRPRLR